jgi:stage II sporulation protein D
MVSAGSTRNGADVLAKDVPYLMAKESSQDVESSEFLKIVEMEKNEYESALKEVFGNDVDNVDISAMDDSGYVMAMSNGEIQVSGEEIANRLDLNSSCFFIDENEEKIKIVTKGQGHGLGLSIYGAWNMAKDGKDYIEILKYYYEGVEIE